MTEQLSGPDLSLDSVWDYFKVVILSIELAIQTYYKLFTLSHLQILGY